MRKMKDRFKKIDVGKLLNSIFTLMFIGCFLFLLILGIVNEIRLHF